MRRVVVVGSTGSGKSTLAGALARRLGAPHVELDALHWDPGWRAAPVELFRQRADAALPADGRWVADGNYGAVRDLAWSRADTLVWLDYPLPVVFWRLLRRSVVRGLRGDELYNGNRESLRTHLLTRQSLFLWLLKTHGRRRREYPALLARPEHGHLSVHRFRWPGDARRWLEAVAPTPVEPSRAEQPAPADAPG